MRRFSFFSSVVFALALLGVAPGSPGQAPQPANLDFETGELGQTPEDWFVPTPGFTATLSAQDAQEGVRCLRLAPGDLGPGEQRAPIGNVMQAFDARPFRGKRIVLEGWVRCEALGDGAAQMWIRVDRANNKMGFFDNMGDRPIRDPKWAKYRIAGDIAKDADQINIGLMISNGASAWADGLTFTVTGTAGEGNQAARTTSERGVSNFVAVAHLSGYIRFFHPSTESLAVDWDSLMIAAIDTAEPAATPAELATALERAFKPIAPSVRVWAGGPAQEPPPDPKPAGATGVTAFRHVGVNFADDPTSIYTTTRVTAALGGEASEGLQPAETCIVKDLGGGVSCRVPVTLYTDGHTTLPKSDGPIPLTTGRPAGWKPTGDDRSTRLAAVMLAWNVLEHFYPYFDTVTVDWPAVLPDTLKAAAVDPDGEAFGRTLRTMLAKAHDGHGGIRSPNDVRGLPLDLDWVWVGDELVVSRAPAADAVTGLAPGDVILSIDRTPVAECMNQLSGSISAATDQWLRFRALYELKTWPQGETAAITARRGSGDKARPVATPVSRAQTTSRHMDGINRPMSGAEIRPGIVYFDLVGASMEDLSKAMGRMAKAKGMVFDMRGYPGEAGSELFQYLTDKTINSARWMLPVVTLPDHEAMTFDQADSWVIDPAEPHLTSNIAFLTDGQAISYAESCMGIVEHYHLGEIVGSTTAGTNGNVNPIPLPGGYTMMYTGMRVLKQDGSRHHGVGIKPTIPCERTIEGITAGRDEVLDKALEVVQAKIDQGAR